jgi:hypothetical protein
MRGKALFAALAVLGFGAPPAPADVSRGLDALERDDYATAVREFRGSAEKGNADAQFSLGLMYAQGQGVPKNQAQALKWYRRAAEKGLAEAQTNLGVMYLEGRGVPQDFAAAAKWYRRAAEQGMSEAQFNLGFLYHLGRGVPQDLVEARKWYDLAASDPFAEPENREEAVRLGASLEETMTRRQIAEAQRRVKAWKAKPERSR